MAGKKKDVIFNFFEQLLMQIAMSQAQRRNIFNKTHLPVPDLLLLTKLHIVLLNPKKVQFFVEVVALFVFLELLTYRLDK